MRGNRKAFACFTLLVAFAAMEVRADARADSLVLHARDRDDGKDIFSEVTLTMFDENGGKRVRELLYFQKDFGRDEKMLLYFMQPVDVKGVGLNSVTYAEASGKIDDQWIYLPAFKQARRIPGSDKRGSFMGSEFSYYDMEKIKMSDFAQKLVGEETVAGERCVKIERTPSSEKTTRKSGYGKTVVWIQPEKGIVMKQVFFNESGFEFKVMKVLALEQIQGVWTVTEAEMSNKESGRRSVIRFSDVRYDCGVNERVFQNETIKEGIGNAYLPKTR